MDVYLTGISILFNANNFSVQIHIPACPCNYFQSLRRLLAKTSYLPLQRIAILSPMRCRPFSSQETIYTSHFWRGECHQTVCDQWSVKRGRSAALSLCYLCMRITSDRYSCSVFSIRLTQILGIRLVEINGWEEGGVSYSDVVQMRCSTRV